MKEFVLIRYLKSTDRDLRFKKVVRLPGVPAIDNAVQLADHSVFIVRCLTFREGGGIFIKIEDEFVQDKDINKFKEQFQADGWTWAD